MSQGDQQLQTLPYLQTNQITVQETLVFKNRVTRNLLQDVALTADESGIAVQVAMPGVNITLPPTSIAFTYEITNVFPTSGSFNLKPAQNDRIVGGGLAKTTAKVLDGQQVVLSNGQIGDSITLTGDGVDGWVITRIVGNGFRYV